MDHGVIELTSFVPVPSPWTLSARTAGSGVAALNSQPSSPNPSSSSASSSAPASTPLVAGGGWDPYRPAIRSFRSAGRDPPEVKDGARWCAVAVGGGAGGPSSSCPSSSCSSAPNRERGSGPRGFSHEAVDVAVGGGVAGADEAASGLDPSGLVTKSPQSSSNAAKAAGCGSARSAAGAGAEAKVKSPKSKSSSRKGAGGGGNATASISDGGSSAVASALAQAQWRVGWSASAKGGNNATSTQ